MGAQNVADFRSQIAASFAESGTESLAVDLRGGILIGIYLPSTFSGTSIKFKVADSLGGTYLSAYNSANTEISYTVAASRYIAIDPTVLKGARFLKVVAGSQSAANTIKLITDNRG